MSITCTCKDSETQFILGIISRLDLAVTLYYQYNSTYTVVCTTVVQLSTEMGGSSQVFVSNIIGSSIA